MGRLIGSKNIPKYKGVCAQCKTVYPKVRKNQECCSRPCYRARNSTAIKKRAAQYTAGVRGRLTLERQSKMDRAIQKYKNNVIQDCILWRENRCGVCTAYQRRPAMKERLGCTRKNP